MLAQTINVSALVTGTTQWLPPVSTAPAVPCGSACGYASVSAVSFADGFQPSVGSGAVSTWPPLLAPHSQLPAPGSLLRSGSIAPPEPGFILNSPAGIGQQALARFTASAGASEPNELSVQTWRSGSGAAVVSYGIRLVTPATGSRHTYLQFRLPAATLGGFNAYKLGGINNSSYEYLKPVQVLSRAAMEVLVDGLPVWSSESNLLRPRRYEAPAMAQLAQQWGPTFGTGSVTLYLGELPAGSTRLLALLLRSDQRVEAPDCQKDLVADPDQQRCHSQKTSLSLPMTTTAGPYVQYVPDVRIFTK